MEDKNIFFNSSMPRSMSTLMQNILNQNPEIYATPTDGSLELLYGARTNYTNSPEFKAQDAGLMKKAWRGFCYYGLQGYANGLTDKPNVCIKSRGIGIHFPWYDAFFQEFEKKSPKIICMVRNVKSILSSMEKLFRENQENHQEVQNHAKMAGTITEKRVDQWLNSPPVGLALERIFQMINDETINKVLVIRAEDLTNKPEEVMKSVYKYLELPIFEHDFDNVEQITKEDDEVYGLTSSLHKIREKVEPVDPDYHEILGRELCKSIDARLGWYQKYFAYIS